MEETIKKHRLQNILICLIGALCCAAALFIPAPEGMLGDESMSMMQIYEGTKQILFIVAPTILILFAAIDVIIGKLAGIAVVLSLAGGVLFGVTDLTLVSGYQGYSGVLVNAIGVILVIAGACLQTFATQRPIAESDSSDVQQETLRPESYSDIYITDTDQFKRKTDPAVNQIDVDMPANHVNKEMQGSINRVTIDRQDIAPQPEVVTDFYAGIEEMFTGDSQNGGNRNE